MKGHIGLAKLFIAIGGLTVAGIVQSVGVSSLSFKSYNSLSFTFNPTVTITISPASGGSSNNLLIDNLTTGNSDVSNAINVGVATNTLGGLVLNATVGNESIAAANVTNLNHTGTASNSKFASIDTDANLASLTTDNTWGYATSTNSGSSWSNYNGLPAYNTETPATLLDITPNPYAEPSSGSIQFRIGAKAGGSQTSGSYTNTINFTAVTKPLITTYTINYSDNSGAGVDIPSSQSGSINTDGAAVALSSATPTRSGYEFVGWCTVSTNDDTCSGAVYQAGENYPITNVGGAVTINLYAMWALPPTMQDFAAGVTSTTCANMSVNDTITLIDARDNQEYTVAKLADNKCWMTKNLNLAGGTELSSDTTDFASNYTLPTTNGWTVNNGKLVLPASAVKNSDNNNLTDRSQFSTNNYAYVYNSSNTTGCGDSGQEKPCYSYYSWDVATLGSGRSISTDNTDAFYSICPKGWKLPTSRTTAATNWQTESDFYVLAHQYGLDSTTSTSESDNGFYTQAGPGTAPNFLLAGFYDNGSFSNGGSRGYYWSSTSYSNSYHARFLYFDSSDVNSANGYYRRYGFSVRCLLRQ